MLDYANTSPFTCLETFEKLSLALGSVDTLTEFTPSFPLTINSNPIALVFCGILTLNCFYFTNDLITLAVFLHSPEFELVGLVSGLDGYMGDYFQQSGVQFLVVDLNR
jgi:hypothetical protein